MRFFLAMNPPTCTAQMHKIRVVKGKPVFYDPPEVKQAKDDLTALLYQHKPDKPLDRAVMLKVMWLFPRGRHSDGEWRITKPDTDNLEKILKDCMTVIGYWKDDAQIVCEHVEKRWANKPGIYIEVNEL